jgi:hypothetical protein
MGRLQEVIVNHWWTPTQPLLEGMRLLAGESPHAYKALGVTTQGYQLARWKEERSLLEPVNIPI